MKYKLNCGKLIPANKNHWCVTSHTIEHFVKCFRNVKGREHARLISDAYAKGYKFITCIMCSDQVDGTLSNTIVEYDYTDRMLTIEDLDKTYEKV